MMFFNINSYIILQYLLDAFDICHRLMCIKDLYKLFNEFFIELLLVLFFELT